MPKCNYKKQMPFKWNKGSIQTIQYRQLYVYNGSVYTIGHICKCTCI